jgi:hypothetical protein
MNQFLKPLSILGMLGSVGIILMVTVKSAQVSSPPVLALLLAAILLPSVWGHFSLQFLQKPADMTIRVALSLNSCWLVLHLIRIYTRADEGHLTNWMLNLPALGVCVANIVTFSAHRIKTIKAARAAGGKGGKGRRRR